MASEYLLRLNYLRDVAAINQDTKSVNKYNNLIDSYFDSTPLRTNTLNSNNKEKKSSRFSVRKQRPNVSRATPSMGYAKPIQHQRILHKYNCMVTGEKRMEPCAGCSNTRGCIANSMQYKEHQT